MTCSTARQSASTSLKSLLSNSSSGTFGFQRQDISHLRSFFTFLEQQHENPRAKRHLSSVRLDDASSMQQALFSLYANAEALLCELLVDYVYTLTQPSSDPPTSNTKQERKPLCSATLEHKMRRLATFLKFAQSQSHGADNTTDSAEAAAPGKTINLLERHHPIWGKLYRAVHGLGSRKKAKTGSDTSSTPAGSSAPCSRAASPTPSQPHSPSASAALTHASAASSFAVSLPRTQPFVPYSLQALASCQLMPMAMMPMQPMHLIMWPCFGLPMHQLPPRPEKLLAPSQAAFSSTQQQQQQQQQQQGKGKEAEQPDPGSASPSVPSSPKAARRVFRPVARPAQAAPWLVEMRPSHAVPPSTLALEAAGEGQSTLPVRCSHAPSASTLPGPGTLQRCPLPAATTAEAAEAAAPQEVVPYAAARVGSGKQQQEDTTRATAHPSPPRPLPRHNGTVGGPPLAASACLCGEAAATSPLSGCAAGLSVGRRKRSLPGPDVKDMLPLPLELLLLQRLRGAGSAAPALQAQVQRFGPEALPPPASPAVLSATPPPASAAVKELQGAARAAHVQRYLSKRKQRPPSSSAAKKQAVARLLQ